MARDPEEPELRVIDEIKLHVPPVIRLSQENNGETRTESKPLPVTTPTRLTPNPLQLEELRTHQPDVEALTEQESIVQSLEETWDDPLRKNHPTPWGWFVLIGLFCAGAASWSVYHLAHNQQKPTTIRNQALEKLENEKLEKAAAETHVNRIIDAVKRYTQAKDPQSLRAVCRFPEHVAPLMEDWYRRHPFRYDPYLSQDQLASATLGNNADFWLLTFNTQSGAKRTLLIEAPTNGEARVDWEWEVGYQPMDWDAYTRSFPQGSFNFRVTIEPDNLYNHEFIDSSRWLCFRISVRDSQEYLFGYVDRRSETAQTLVDYFNQFGTTQRMHPMILRISRPADLKSPRGIVIEKVLSTRWFYLSPPDA